MSAWLPNAHGKKPQLWCGSGGVRRHHSPEEIADWFSSQIPHCERVSGALRSCTVMSGPQKSTDRVSLELLGLCFLVERLQKTSTSSLRAWAHRRLRQLCHCKHGPHVLVLRYHNQTSWIKDFTSSQRCLLKRTVETRGGFPLEEGVLVHTTLQYHFKDRHTHSPPKTILRTSHQVLGSPHHHK